MKLNKLKEMQAMQKDLDQSILDKKPEMTEEERFTKTLVALSVELAEVANCAEHFKFWKDNKGKVDTKVYHEGCTAYVDEKGEKVGENEIYYSCKGENGDELELSFEEAHKLTLVEECADALHFVLSLANQLEVEYSKIVFMNIDIKNKEDSYLYITRDISSLFHSYIHLPSFNSEISISILFSSILNYFKLLGVTAEELEKAYYDKHKVNYKRQEEGY